eukprot:c41355_g1_i1 orf=168-446(+)
MGLGPETTRHLNKLNRKPNNTFVKYQNSINQTVPNASWKSQLNASKSMLADYQNRPVPVIVVNFAISLWEGKIMRLNIIHQETTGLVAISSC